MDYEYKRLRAYADEIGRRIVRRRAGVPVAGRPCGYGADERRTPDSAFPPLPEGGAWGGKRDSHWWFRAHFRVPEEFQGDLWLEFADAKEGFDACNPQFTAYLDKVPVQGLDVNHTRLKLGGMREGVLDIYAYTGSEIDEILHISCSVIETDPAAEALFYDMDVPLGAMEYLPENTEEYRALRAALSESVALLDLRSEECAARTMSLCSKYLRENLYGEREERAAVCCVGHTHIDLAWLWPLRQTPEKAERSFLTALELMREDPAYTFLCSQPQLYEWFEERCPEAFAELKERVAEGRWLAEGGTWIEPDCNLISGESLVRQFWYGSLYFREKFGTESRILWLPDTFGFPANLPQIAKKCGMKFFVTSKLSWNERDRMPHDLFYFRGIDGSEIAAYFLTAQDRIRNADPVNYTTYNASTDAKQIAGTYARFADTDLADEVLLTYGFGDGGGGPTRNNLQQLSRLRRGMPGCPRVLCGAPGGFFERLEKKSRS